MPRVALRTCRVTCWDLKDIEHTVEVAVPGFVAAKSKPLERIGEPVSKIFWKEDLKPNRSKVSISN